MYRSWPDSEQDACYLSLSRDRRYDLVVIDGVVLVSVAALPLFLGIGFIVVFVSSPCARVQKDSLSLPNQVRPIFEKSSFPITAPAFNVALKTARPRLGFSADPRLGGWLQVVCLLIPLPATCYRSSIHWHLWFIWHKCRNVGSFIFSLKLTVERNLIITTTVNHFRTKEYRLLLLPLMDVTNGS